MQCGVFRMPHNPITRIDRRCSYSKERLLWQIEPGSGDDRSYILDELCLGTHSVEVPSDTYKAIYISSDSKWIFEAVYTEIKGLCICLYVKMIGDYTCVGVPFETVLHYSANPEKLKPLRSILRRIDWSKNVKNGPSGFDTILSVVQGSERIDEEVIDVFSHWQNFVDRDGISNKWKPLYVHEPGLFGALITGSFARVPHYEVQYPHAAINMMMDCRGSNERYNLSYRSNALSGKIYCDHKEFDSVILSIIDLPVCEFAISVSFADGIEGLINTGVIHNYADPYSEIIHRPAGYSKKIFNELSRILEKSIWLYSHVFDVDVCNRRSPLDKSTIYISKNIFDEVTIEFRDTQENTHIGIYSNLIGLSLTTQDVGSFIVDG